MKKYEKITPEGTRDLLFEECEVLRGVQKKVEKLFKALSYNEVITPGIEFYDVFNVKSMYMPQESMYKLIDKTGKILVIRPDSTVPIARLVSTKLKNYQMPIRLYYNQDIYKINQTLTGRANETIQMGIELIGDSSVKSDLEVLSSALKTLSMCDARKYRIEIGHIGIFKALADKMPVSDEEKEDIRMLIQSKNFAALNDILDKFGDNEGAVALKMLPALFGGKEVFKKAEKIFSDETTLNILAYLKNIYQILCDANIGGEIVVDLGTVSSVDYYTGVVFKGYIDGAGEAVLSGGRYDNLMANFGFYKPAVGFAIDLNMVSKNILANNNVKKISKENTYLIYADDNNISSAFSLMDSLIKDGEKCEMSFANNKKEAELDAKNNNMILKIVGEV